MAPMNSKYRPLITLVALLGAVSLFAAPASPDEPPAALSQLSTKAQVASLLALASGTQDVDLEVGDFLATDLDGDGEPELVASIDYSGRNFFNRLMVAWQEPDRTRVQTLDVWHMEKLAGTVQDLDGDGRKELLVQELLTPYLGIRPYAVWTAIKSLEAAQFAESSSRFPAFYETKVLPHLESELTIIDPAADKHVRQVTEIAYFTVLRVLGRDRNAGLERALVWSSDSDPLTRIYAVSVLQEIEDPAAAKALARLAEDADREVAGYARAARETPRPRAQQLQ